MAQLESAGWTVSQTRAQYAAITWLRWRMLVNGLRRKGGRGEFISRILTIPVAAILLIMPTLAAGFFAWYLASEGTLAGEAFLLWAVFVFSQLVNINLGQPGTTFDPTELIRFPMQLGSYTAIRLFFGLLAPANIVICVMSLSIAVGVSVAIPSLWTYALLALFVFALTNVLFTRMLFAWIDRWMSTRRAREIFTALVFVISIGFQYLNVTFNPAYNHHRTHHAPTQSMSAAMHVLHRAQPVLGAFPPGLTANALTEANAGNTASSLVRVAACAAFAIAFLGIFVLRMRVEFRGENLSDTANGVANPKSVSASQIAASLPGQTAAAAPQHMLRGMPAITAVLGKEFLYLRRNSGMFYGLVAPLVMVLLFAGRLAMRQSTWIFPAALAYTLMGLAPFAYNSFGLEGAGAQFFFFAPVRLRDVFLGKNLMNFLTAAVEVLAVVMIISYLGSRPTVLLAGAGLLWAAGTMLFSTTIGNFRSISAPKKILLNRMANKQASALSAFMSLGLLLVASAFGAGLLLAGKYFGLNWLLLPVLFAYAMGGLITYITSLNAVDRYALDHREAMFEELCKP